MAKRKQYDKAFKMETVQQWQESGKSAAEMAEQLGISTSSLYTWRDQYADELAFADEQEAGDESLAADEPVAEPIPEPAPAEEPVEEKPVEEKVVAEEGAAVAVAATSAAEPEIEKPEKGGAKVVVKRIFGGVGVFLGGLGLILSIAFIIVVWVVNKPVTAGTVELVGKITTGLTVANNGLDQADDTLSNVRQQLRDVTEAIPLEGLQSTITDIIALVDGIKTTVDTAASVVGLADTFPVSLLRRDAEAVDTPQLDEASNTLGQISTSLGNVEALLQERQDSGLGPVGTQVDTQIDDLQTRIQEVNQGVEEGIDTTAQLQEDLPGIIDTIAIVITLLLIWLGVAQYALLVNGWHWVRWP